MTNTRGERLPLSSAQAGVWFADQMDPTGCAFNIGEYLIIDGPVDPASFEAAARQVAGEVQALRIRLERTNGVPKQFVCPATDWTMSVYDLTREACPEEAALAWIRADFTRPLDLLRDPLVMWALFKLGQNRFLWCHRYHHMVMDAVGMSLIVRRMANVYTALADGLTPMRIVLAHCVSSLMTTRAYRASEQFAADRDYWMNLFAKRPEPARLGGLPGAHGGGILRETAYLSPSSMAGMRNTAEEAATRWPIVMIAATAAYLYRMTGLQEVIVGVTVTGRTNSITRQIPGMAANLLHVPIEVRPEEPGIEFLERTSRMIRGRVTPPAVPT